ncbi:competence/damage-inducible protein A [Salinibacillus xinjiangensis]|uniref:Putative competence-damage inducible protein n=1 Tax=Salinibacillus xinjiangensis TaxID=1229268 RepID=A0A6G1X311_9BACI|nr:competence/damage-inducible protein A [Salinibacillus xinjiangensis]MRG85332.1 competence/damage-inducible protein A [Salinibacillus xinjiangensis]
MKDMNAEILSVGSELLLGQIVNSNAQWLSKRLADLGINVFYHHTIGDNFNRLEQAMRLAKERSDLVIVTGGLGPTDDDLTREVASQVINQPIEVDAQVLAKVESYFQKRNQTMTENNRKQAHVFQGSTVFPNDEGMSPGIFTEHENTGWVFLPGVPREMKSIFNQSIDPFLKQKYSLNQKIYSRVLKFIGIGESLLEDRIADIMKKQTNPTIAPLAGDGEVTLRLTAKTKTEESANAMIAKVEKEVLQRVGDYYYGADHETVENRVFQILKDNSLTLSSAESITGGRFIDRMISLPGASTIILGSIVCYQREIKENILKVSKDVLDQHGTVSAPCASELANNIQTMMNSDIGISFTGNAGPNPIEGKEVGLVYIGLKIGSQEPLVESIQVNGTRENIRNRAVKKGFELLYHYLKQYHSIE